MVSATPKLLPQEVKLKSVSIVDTFWEVEAKLSTPDEF